MAPRVRDINHSFFFYRNFLSLYFWHSPLVRTSKQRSERSKHGTKQTKSQFFKAPKHVSRHLLNYHFAKPLNLNENNFFGHTSFTIKYSKVQRLIELFNPVKNLILDSRIQFSQFLVLTMSQKSKKNLNPTIVLFKWEENNMIKWFVYIKNIVWRNDYFFESRF